MGGGLKGNRLGSGAGLVETRKLRKRGSASHFLSGEKQAGDKELEMKKTLLMVLMIVPLLACAGTEDPNSPGEDYGKLRFDGTVKHVDLEGGGWIIERPTGKRYEPVNLPEKYKQDGLEVHVVARPRRDMGTILMMGEIIEVLEIKRR